MTDWWSYAQYPAFFILGAVVSLINSIAGGGSTLSLPIMIFLGLPATVANGTNRIGLIIGNFSIRVLTAIQSALAVINI